MISKIKELSNKHIHGLLVAALCIISIAFGFAVSKEVNVFKISDGNFEKTVRILGNSANKAIKCLSFDSDEYEIIKTNKKDGVYNVKIGYKFPVKIVVDERTVEVNTAENTVSNILKLAGFNFDDYDLVNPTADTVISESCTISYSDVDFVSGSYLEAIPATLDTEYTAEKEIGDNTIIEGTDGSKQVYYTSKIVNGKQTEMVVNDVVLLSSAVNGKQIIGTAKRKATAVKTSDEVGSVSTLNPETTIELDENGVPVNYKKAITVQATGYTYTGRKCSTGVSPQPGYIAVNPRIIPYGTKMYIKSQDGSYIYGYAVAADTGGFVKSRPSNVDLFFSTRSACTTFGRRNVEIYILE